jgi:hypothetical protein
MYLAQAAFETRVGTFEGDWGRGSGVLRTDDVFRMGCGFERVSVLRQLIRL